MDLHPISHGDDDNDGTTPTGQERRNIEQDADREEKRKKGSRSTSPPPQPVVTAQPSSEWLNAHGKRRNDDGRNSGTNMLPPAVFFADLAKDCLWWSRAAAK